MAGTEVVGLAPETSAARLVFAQLLVQGQAFRERYQKFAALFLLPGAQAGQAGRVGGGVQSQNSLQPWDLALWSTHQRVSTRFAGWQLASSAAEQKESRDLRGGPHGAP